MTAVMDLLLAIVLGLAGGFAEFFLLRLTVRVMLEGRAGLGFALFFAKLGVLFAAILPVAFISPGHLAVCGLCVSLPLVVCSAIAFFKTRAKPLAAEKTKEKDTGDDKQ